MPETCQRISEANLRVNLSRNPGYVKRSSDQGRLVHSLRCRVAQLVTKKNLSTLKLLDCTWEEFYVYIEQQFVEGMTWANYGKKGWHLDHKVPLSAFDLTDPEQMKEACHHSNLQPLWWFDNLEKSNRIDWKP